MGIQVGKANIIQNEFCFSEVKTLIIGPAMRSKRKFVNPFISHMMMVVISPAV